MILNMDEKKGSHRNGTMWRDGKLLSYVLRFKISNKRKGSISTKAYDVISCCNLCGGFIFFQSLNAVKASNQSKPFKLLNHKRCPKR